MPSSADQHLERALDAQPHHHLGTDPERAQMMRQLARARIELAIAQALVLEHHRDRIRASAPPAPRTAPAGWRTGPRARCRSTRAGWCGARRGRECRARRSPARDRQPPPPAAEPAGPPSPPRSRDRTGRWRIPALPSIPAGVPSAPRCSARLSDRSNLALALATGSKPVLSPASSRLTSALFCSTSITWNSGCRDSERAGLSTSTSRSNGSSWWP